MFINKYLRYMYFSLLLSFFWAILLSLLFVLHILSGCRKKLGVDIMGKVGALGHTTIFAPNLIKFFSICRVRTPSISKTDWCVDRSILALSTKFISWISGDIYLMVLQAVQIVWSLKGHDPFNQNFRKFRSKTEWIGSVQPEKFWKKSSTFRGGPLFLVGPVRLKCALPFDHSDPFSIPGPRCSVSSIISTN